MNNSSRTRAWRRAQRQRYIAKRRQVPHVAKKINCGVLLPSQLGKTKVSLTHIRWRDQKQWKFLWQRRQKLARAKQLKLFYPRKCWNQEIEDVE